MTLKVESWVVSLNHSLSLYNARRGREEESSYRIGFSLRSKRSRVVSKQRKTEERDLRSFPREKWNESSNLSLIPCCLLRNRTETLSTQATLGRNLLFVSSKSNEIPSLFNNFHFFVSNVRLVKYFNE